MSITKRTNGNGTVYLARVWHEGKPVRSKTFKLRRDAQRWESEQLAQLADKGERSLSLSRETLSTHIERWANEPVRPGTAKNRALVKANLGHLSDMEVSQILTSDIRDWVAQLRGGRPWAGGKPVADSTAKDMLSKVSAVLGRLEADRIIDRNPCRGVRVKAGSSAIHPADIPSLEEVRLAMAAAEEMFNRDLRAIIFLGAKTGMRVSEVLGLQPRDFNRKALTIQVERQLSDDGAFTKLKTSSSRRVVPVGSEVFDELGPILRRWSYGPMFLREGCRTEGIWTRKLVTSAMSQLRKKVGITWRFHSLRHYYASSLLHAGVSIKAVQGVLGHSSATVTLGTYAHVMPQDESNVRSASAALSL